MSHLFVSQYILEVVLSVIKQKIISIFCFRYNLLLKSDDSFFKIYYFTISSSKVFKIYRFIASISSKVLIKNFITFFFFILEKDPVSFPFFLLLFQWKLITRQLAKNLISISASNDIHIKKSSASFFWQWL